MTVTRVDAVQGMLAARAPADLAERYNPGLETFVEVDPSKGEQVYESDLRPIPNTYADGTTTFFSFRMQEAGDFDKRLPFPLDPYWSSIGISGMDVVNNTAIGVGFDFDSLTNHHDGVGLTTEQLAAVLEAIKRLPYAEIRRSTSGCGFHVWVWFGDELPKVTNRNEMKALARAVIARMSFDTGHDLTSDVDHCGDLLWIAAKRATPENQGLTLFKAAEHPMHDWPRDFLDHLDVVTRKRSHTRLRGVDETESDRIAHENKDRPRVPLDAKHRRLMELHQKTNFEGYWNQDLGCYVGHTYPVGLALEELNLPGVYQTLSKGSDPNKPNCYMFPLEDGAWRVFRFGAGAREAKTWSESKNGWTTCVIGRLPTIKQLMHRFGGRWNGRGVTFLRDVRNVLEAIGAEIELLEWMDRPLTFIPQADGLAITCPRNKETDNEHEANLAGWFEYKGPVWRIVLDIVLGGEQADHQSTVDQLIRHVSCEGEQVGLFARTQDGWEKHSRDQIVARLAYEGFSKPGDRLEMLGWASRYPYQRGAWPFQVEYPGGRRWNLDGCRLKFAPSPGETPTWDMILQHLGRGLDNSICDWCQAHGIETGADYLRHWYANMIRFPERRLPMLAVYSPEQNIGKSLLHEAPAILFDERG